MPLNRSELGLNMTMFFSKYIVWTSYIQMVWCLVLGGFVTCSYMDGHLCKTNSTGIIQIQYTDTDTLR